MMQWVLPLAAACVMLGAPAQPTSCDNDSHCDTGYYCQQDVHACRRCLQCADLSRQPPLTADSCIRSVLDCGPCLEGLVYDAGVCTEPEATDSSLPAYVIVIIVICLLLFGLVVVALVYVLRHKDTFKIMASTRTSVQAPVSPPPSAPAPPPPYHEAAPYEHERPASPPLPHTLYRDDGVDPSVPLVKRAPRGPGASEAAGARESAGSQAARVYNAPAWVRNANPPPSYDSSLDDKSEPESPFVPQDEDTMESAWTPAAPPRHDDCDKENTPSANETPNEGASFSLALRRPARTETISPPPKIIRLEDSNNNRNTGESSGLSVLTSLQSVAGALPPPPGYSAPPPAPPPAAPSVVINVLNVSSLHQHNDVTL